MKNHKLPTGYLLKQFLPYFKPYKGIFILDLICATLTTVCELVLPVIVRYITNTVTYNPAMLTIATVGKVTAIYLALRVVDVIAAFYMQDRGHVMGALIENDMRKELFEHCQQLSYSYYSENKIGQLVSRITTDLFDIAEFSHHCPEEYFIAAVKITVSFIILMNVNVTLTLVLFALIPIMIAAAMTFRDRLRKAFKKQRSELGEINSRVEDSLLGIKVSKSFANEEVEQQNFMESSRQFVQAKKDGYRSMAYFGGTTRLFDGIMYIAIVFLGSVFMIRGNITSGDFIAYLLYVNMLLVSVRRIVDYTEQFQRGMTGIERFVEIMDEPIEIQDAEDAVVLPDVLGNIAFDNVSFSYSDSDVILNNINLKVRAGENIALVGPSGAGKTTFCNLIPRFYDVTGGSITVDGHDIRTVTCKSLRSQIGMVQQDVYLFSDTVAGNIGYGKPGASREEIIRAAKLAGADEFIRELPNGYDTYVGERGAKLSGGQKQRISIARVFLKNPPILILDEATSALDNESELLVQKSLAALSLGRTTITIAHRLTTIKNADRIIVLTDEGIAEEGTHDELIELDGIYAGMYHMYEL